jgi:hypothetical protein
MGSPHSEEVNKMNAMQKAITGAAVAGSLLTGGVIGATLAGPLGASAASNSTNTGTTAAVAATSAAPFVSNENATHEAGESAAREAQENAGQRPTVP